VFDRLYARLIALAATKQAPLWLMLVAFAEASFFPIPPDALLLPMVIARRERAWLYAALCTVGSVLGGLLGWAIGAFLLQTIALPIVHAYHAEATLAALQARFQHYGVWIVLIKGLTPIPYKFVTIASGAAHFALVPFMLASLVTRGARFFLEAALLYRFGPPIRTFVERRLTLVAFVVLLAFVGGFLALKFA